MTWKRCYSKNLEMKKVDAAVSRSACTLGKSRREYEADVCYVLRVMMSHIRAKRKLVVDDKKNSSDGKLNEKIHPLWLQEFYKTFGDKADALVTPRKEKPAQITKGSGKCIFVNFRKAFSQTGDSTDSEDDESNGDPPPHVGDLENDMRVAHKGWCSYRNEAILRFSNGYVLPAASYAHGPEGFVIASWTNGETCTLEVPNGQCTDDGKLTVPRMIALQKIFVPTKTGFLHCLFDVFISISFAFVFNLQDVFLDLFLIEL